MNAIEFNNIWKKFRKGERFNSIRDALPNFFHRMLRKKNNSRLDSQEFWVLKDVSFKVGKGEVLGIIGPNGAGKSTTLKLLSRIMNPTKGQLQINGRLSALIEITAGFHPELTGRENIYLNGTILGMKRKEIEAKFDEIVEFSGLSEFIDTPVKRYSSGMWSRLGFSVAAHMDPEILLVDEVLSVGDMAFQAKCAEKMRAMLNSGVTIVIVSHNISLIQSLCQRVILLDKGEILKQGTPDEVLPYYQNIVFSKREEELRKKTKACEYKVKVREDLPVKILNLTLYDGQAQQQDSFNPDEPISIKVDYQAAEKIASPIFSLDIVRADGVLCCSSNSKDNGFKVDTIQGQGSLRIDLGRLNLAGGIYIPQITIWDRDMLHPYAVKNNDILKINQAQSNTQTRPVFLAKMEWERNDLE